MRARITDRFGELHHDREQAQAQLDALQAAPRRPPTPPCSMSCRWPGTSCPAWTQPSKPACGVRVTNGRSVPALWASTLSPASAVSRATVGAYGWYNFFIRVGVTAGHLVMGSCDDRRRRQHHAGRAGPVSARALGTSACAGSGVRAGTSGPLAQELSPSELRVLRCLPTNLSRPQIARELCVSLNTVSTHLRRIYAKLGADDRSAAVHRARELRLLSASSRALTRQGLSIRNCRIMPGRPGPDSACAVVTPAWAREAYPSGPAARGGAGRRR